MNKIKTGVKELVQGLRHLTCFAMAHIQISGSENESKETYEIGKQIQVNTDLETRINRGEKKKQKKMCLTLECQRAFS